MLAGKCDICNNYYDLTEKKQCERIVFGVVQRYEKCGESFSKTDEKDICPDCGKKINKFIRSLTPKKEEEDQTDTSENKEVLGELFTSCDGCKYTKISPDSYPCNKCISVPGGYPFYEKKEETE